MEGILSIPAFGMRSVVDSFFSHTRRLETHTMHTTTNYQGCHAILLPHLNLFGKALIPDKDQGYAASDWQRNQAEQREVKLVEPLTEKLAEQLAPQQWPGRLRTRFEGLFELINPVNL